MTHRRWLSAWGPVAVLVCLSACSRVSPDSWQVAPIEFDNALDGGAEDRIDVTYPMANMTGDTAGGFWTESAGSWLHLDRDGDTLRRFNDEAFTTVHGISAISPTRLAVSRTDRADALGRGTGLFLYDTDAETWTRVVDATMTGDVVAEADGRILFVDFLGETVPQVLNDRSGLDETKPFAIRAVDATGRQSTVLGADAELSAAAVAIDVDSAGKVYVSTDRETFSISVDGTRSPIGTHSKRRPVLAVNAAGDVLTESSTTTDAADVDWTMARGSSTAREVMSDKGDCSQPSDGGLAILTAGKATFLPFSCNTNGAAWISDTTFVLSIGDEAGTILTRVSPPGIDSDR